MPEPTWDPARFDLPPEERVPQWVLEAPSALDERMGVVIAELTPERCVGRAPVEGNTQPMRMWHGGASGVLVESLASLAATAHALEMGKVAVGVDLNVTHHSAVRKGHVTGVATALRRGRSVATYGVQLFDDAHRLVASGRLTCQLVKRPG